MTGPAIEELALRPLISISPSRFLEAERCGLRAAWAAARNPDLLPGSPARRFGTVIHRLLEEAERGMVSGEAATAGRFDTLVAAADAEMQQSWLERRHIPLSESVADYVEQRHAALAAAGQVAADAMAHVAAGGGRRRSGAEVRLVARDGRIAGRADRILATSSSAVIQDTKTGPVFEAAPGGGRQLKRAFATQLHLYAALYAEDTEVSGGAWPARLEIVPPGGTPIPVPFDPAACTQLLDQAEALLDILNQLIKQPATQTERELSLASPSAEVCRWCPYRPACRAYLKAANGRADRPQWPNDVWGTIVDIRQLGNGTISLTVDAAGHPVRVRGLSRDPQLHPLLGQLQPGARVAIFNLIAQGGTSTLGEGPYTAIYLG
jgi:hypothetical protein